MVIKVEAQSVLGVGATSDGFQGGKSLSRRFFDWQGHWFHGFSLSLMGENGIHNLLSNPSWLIGECFAEKLADSQRIVGIHLPVLMGNFSIHTHRCRHR